MRIVNPHPEHITVVPETDSHKLMCKRALGAAQVEFRKVMSMDKVELFSSIDASISRDIVQGLANIALGEYGERGFGNLSQARADDVLTNAYGSMLDYLPADFAKRKPTI